MMVDLTSQELNSAAVVGFIRAHVTKRPSHDILFKVSRVVHKMYCGKKPAKAVKVSKDELAKLNVFVKRSLRSSDFLLRKRVKCAQCGKVLTFYDLFESGRQEHGDERVGSWFDGVTCYVHIQARGRKTIVKCTSCGEFNELLLAGYDGPNY